MLSGKSCILVGMQDTDKPVRHVRLSADERKRLSSLANWKPLGHSVLQVGTADFLFSPTLFGSLLRTPIPKAHPLVCHSEWPQSSNLLGSLPRREGTEVASMYESVSSNHRILSSCRLMFDCSYDKVKIIYLTY